MNCLFVELCEHSCYSITIRCSLKTGYMGGDKKKLCHVKYPSTNIKHVKPLLRAWYSGCVNHPCVLGTSFRGLHGSFSRVMQVVRKCRPKTVFWECRSERHSSFRRKDLNWLTQAPTETFYLSGGSLTFTLLNLLF
jgi:hypothetical protein